MRFETCLRLSTLELHENILKISKKCVTAGVSPLDNGLMRRSAKSHDAPRRDFSVSERRCYL